MKNLFSTIALGCFLLTVSNANASFFDNNGGKMDIDEWVPESDAQSLVDYANNDHLEFSATIPENNNGKTDNGWVDIHSKWALSLNQDFNISTGFHVDYLGTNMIDAPDNYNKVEAYIQLSDMNATQDGRLHYIELAAKNDIHNNNTQNNGTAWNAYMLGVGGVGVGDPETIDMTYTINPSVNPWGEPPLEPTYWWNRASVDGVFTYDYDASEDILTATMQGANGEMASATFNGLRQTTKIDELYVSLGVWANEPANFTKDKVYFYNFQLEEGSPNAVATPEPASIALLGSGLVGMFFRRKKA